MSERVAALMLWGLLLAAAGTRAMAGQEPTSAVAPATYSVPYRLSETSHIMLRAKIGGHGPYTFIMDTGAPSVFITKDVATAAGVKADKDGWGLVDRLQVEGGIEVKAIHARVEEPAQLMGMNAMGLASDHIDGVLGYNLLSLFRIQIDLTRSKMVWTRVDYTPRLPDLVGAEVDQLMQHSDFKKAVKGVKQMNGMADMAGTLMARPKAPPNLPRGFFGLELADTPQGPRIKSVLAQGPAAQAGLAADDLLIRLAAPNQPATDVHTVSEMLRAVRGTTADETVVFVVMRGERRVKVAVRAGKEGF